MMKKQEILFVAFGSLGDIFPLLAIAQRMQKEHKVTFLANEYFRTHIESTGVSFFSIGSIEDQLAATESQKSTGATLEGAKRRYENIVGKSYQLTYDFISDEVAKGGKLLVVTHGNLSPAVIACEAYNIPIVYTYYAPSQIQNNYEDSILCASFYGKNEWWLRHIKVPFSFLKQKFKFELQNEFNRHRKNFGLPPVRSQFQDYWKGLLFRKKMHNQSIMRKPVEVVLAPQWFCEPIDKRLTHLKFIGFPFVTESTGHQEKDIEQFIHTHGKPIVFTPGTAVEDLEAFAKEIIPICRKLAAPAIFCSKHGKAVFEKLDKPADVPLMFVEYANMTHLLPKARCIVHHGGIGTLAQAVRAGIPQIVRPRMYDQPANGVRVMMFGLGGSIFPNVFNADSVANILIHIENSQMHREFIAYYSDLVQREDGVENCAEIIKKILIEEYSEHAELIENSAAH